MKKWNADMIEWQIDTCTDTHDEWVNECTYSATDAIATGYQLTMPWQSRMMIGRFHNNMMIQNEGEKITVNGMLTVT